MADLAWPHNAAKTQQQGPSISEIASQVGAGPTGHTIAIVNQKGGVGKSTTAVNLSASLALLGHRILLLDLDPQGNSTSGVGVSSGDLTTSIYQVLIGGEPLERAIRPTATEHLDLVPANLRLAGAEVELVPQIARETKLRTAIAPVQPRYDAVLIDCPPSLGLLTVNALVAAESCLVPVQCEYYALEGLTQLMDTIGLIRHHLNPGLRIAGVVLTMVDPRTKLSEQVAAEVRRHFAEQVFSTEIPRSVRLAEAPSYGQPVLTYARSSRGAEAYLSLGRELLERMGMKGAEPDSVEPSPSDGIPGGAELPAGISAKAGGEDRGGGDGG